MADQTDIAVYSGFIAAPTSAILFKSFTGLTGWISYPVGAVIGFALVFIAVVLLISIAGVLFGMRNPACEPGDEERPSTAKTVRSLCKISLLCSFLSLLACCGFLLYEQLYGNREPATPRLEMSAMMMLACLYVIVLLVPSLLVMRRSSKVGLFCMSFLNFSGALATSIGFLSLLF